MLTNQETQLLLELRNPEVRTVGRARLTALLNALDRVNLEAGHLERKVEASAFFANNLWLAASGVIGEAEIANHSRLQDPACAGHRNDLLALVQLRYDAQAWRESSGCLPGQDLPEAQLQARTNPLAEPVYAEPFAAGQTV